MMDINFTNAQDFDVGFEAGQSATVTITGSEDAEVDFGQPIQIDVAFESGIEMGCSFAQEEAFECDFGKPVDESDYTGTYEVTPTSSEQFLQTANKTLAQNINVHKTPYYEASNISGGYTATIL